MEMAKDLQEDFLRQIVRFPVLSDDAHRLHLNRPTVMPMNLRECLLVSLLRHSQPMKHLAALHLLCFLAFHSVFYRLLLPIHRPNPRSILVAYSPAPPVDSLQFRLAHLEHLLASHRNSRQPTIERHGIHQGIRQPLAASPTSPPGHMRSEKSVVPQSMSSVQTLWTEL
jgi:hypothetical protein